jgi:hypothetical protein
VDGAALWGVRRAPSLGPALRGPASSAATRALDQRPRDQVLALACLRLGHPTGYAKGADLLPRELRASLVSTLVCSLEEAELRRALAAAAAALAAEVERTDAELATRLRPILSEFSEVEP